MRIGEVPLNTRMPEVGIGITKFKVFNYKRSKSQITIYKMSKIFHTFIIILDLRVKVAY